MATIYRSLLDSVRAATVIVAAWMCVSSGFAQTYDGPVFKAAPIHNSATSTTNNNGAEPTQTIIYQYQPPPMPMFDCGMGQPSGGAAEARAHMLDKEGPQLPKIFSMSSFSVMGFVKGSWPVVFDYELERDSLLIVVVAPEGQEPVIYRLNGKKGHWQNRLTIPAQVGTNPTVAQYVIRSLDDDVGQATPTHFHIHGIAAGPKAVGSIGIDQVTFGPAAIRTNNGEKAHYMFHSMYDFKNVEVNFVRLALSGNQIIAARVGKKSVGSISRNDQRNGDWDGKSDGGGKDADSYPPEIRQWLKLPRGQHLVQVRAWYGAKDGDWATAFSEDYVTVE